MAVDNSTLGVKLYYAVEGTAGTRPTTLSAYTQITGVKNIPGIGEEASAIDVTPLEEPVGGYRQYVPGLKDTGGNLAITCNMTDAFQTAWSALISAYATGHAANKDTWFCVVHPNLAKAFYFTGEPVSLGFTATGVNEAMNATANIVAGKIHGWDTKPTSST